MHVHPSQHDGDDNEYCLMCALPIEDNSVVLVVQDEDGLLWLVHEECVPHYHNRHGGATTWH